MTAGHRPVLLLLAGVACLIGAEFHYREALPHYVYQFPKDHFEHSDFRTEWWYYTGNVRDSSGERFGFELVFFRQGGRTGDSSAPSAWRVDDVYLAHAAITDVSAKRFFYTERLNRAGPGIAGASFAGRAVWNGNWRAQWDGERQSLSAIAEDFRFQLRLQPLKPLVIQGVNGVSQKAEGAGRASHYVSFPRLKVSGSIQVGEQNHTVDGFAWMDHEWFSSQLDSSERGWDWFSVQLDNGTEFMLFDLRKEDGPVDPHSSGTFVNAEGKAVHLTSKQFALQPLEFWGKYPVKWRIEIPSLSVKLECTAAIPNQELKTRGTSYWEGAVDYSGTHKGVGYLEMTGYDKPVTLR